MGDHGDREPVGQRIDDGQADSVDGDRTLLDDVARQVGRHPHPEIRHRFDDLADRVDMALHQVAAQAVGESHGTFEVHRVTGRQRPE